MVRAAAAGSPKMEELEVTYLLLTFYLCCGLFLPVTHLSFSRHFLITVPDDAEATTSSLH